MDMVAMLREMHDSMVQALRGMPPNQNPPRLTESAPKAWGEFIRLWGEFLRNTTAVNEGMAR